MKKPSVNIVWIKRDIRLQDHAPIAAAEKSNIPYLMLYIFEPKMMEHPASSLRHWQFCWHSLQQQNKLIAQKNRKVEICYGEATEVFNFYLMHYEIKQVLSYQETDGMHSWLRDKQISSLLKSKGISWTQFQRDGIIRGIKNREGWDKKWMDAMNAPKELYLISDSTLPPIINPFLLPLALISEFNKFPSTFQPAGETFAWKYLKSFAEERGKLYQKNISKPLKSRTSCGRISVYLAWGNISIRQAYQFVYTHPNYQKNKRAFNAFLRRLKWHCHFIQKFEMQCSYENRCLNKGFEQLQTKYNKDYIKAWKDGKTGFPLIDACMRCLAATGWLNFRMRAMLVSFFCHHLNQDWRDGVYYLAQLFLDYEPGIHYCQFQMQAGTTGINTIRIYNPIKQSLEHDSEGSFIRKWLPELNTLSDSQIHEPEKMPLLDALFLNFRIGIDYPLPLIDLKINAKSARERLWGHLNTSAVLRENSTILAKHTRPQRQK